ncbi:MAG: hypothetical protein SFW65_00465 [Alphaproteobacteria bacterium]|nr:hypothetical protein [Alphaproteobacteria bacterium]
MKNRFMTVTTPSKTIDLESISPPLPAKKFPTWLLQTLTQHNPNLPEKPATEGVTFVQSDLLSVWQATGGSLMVTPASDLSVLKETQVYMGAYSKDDTTTRAIRMSQSDLERRKLRAPSGKHQFIYFNIARMMRDKPTPAPTTEQITEQTTEQTIETPLLPTPPEEPLVEGLTASIKRELRAKRLKSKYTAFIGPKIRTIAALQKIAAREVVEHNGIVLSRDQRIALFIYRDFIRKPADVVRKKKYATREESYHAVQEALGVPHDYMRHAMRAERARVLRERKSMPDALNKPPLPFGKFFAGILRTSLADLRDKQNAGKFGPLDAAWKKFVYLWDDREFMAKLDKVFLRAGFGSFPQSSAEILPALNKLGVALGGLDDLKNPDKAANDRSDDNYVVWERSKINGKYCIALAEVNSALVAAFPKGAPEFFIKQALPYYFAMMAYSYTNDVGVFEHYGFDKPAVLGFFHKSEALPQIEAAFTRRDLARNDLLPSAKDPRTHANFG